MLVGWLRMATMRHVLAPCFDSLIRPRAVGERVSRERGDSHTRVHRRTEHGDVLNERAGALGHVGPMAVLAEACEDDLDPARFDHPVLVGICKEGETARWSVVSNS
jgi:hypothetical protein